MSSGRRELVFNTQERAVSVDLNRAQKFASQDLQEMLRYAWDVGGNDDLDAGSIGAENLGSTSPLTAEIIGGLMVRPQVGTTFSTIDGGVLQAIAPDNAVDDSPYKYIRHVATGETLNVAPNASGSTRIDVIECRPAVGQAQVSDSRDVFNPSTGLFTAAQVVKETKGYLEFRTRQGVAGSGFPGTATGWTPLAVASVPNGSTSNDTVTFWDVRALMNDREFGPSKLESALPPGPQTIGRVDTTTLLSDVRFYGKSSAVLNGRRVGGRMRRGSPGVDATEYINLGDVANHANGSLAWTVSTGFYHLYLATPFGLPRWARYTDASTGVRQPRSPRGIPVVSATSPDHLTGKTSSLVLPTSLGFGAGVLSDAVCVFSALATSAVGPFMATASGYSASCGSTGSMNVTGTYNSGDGRVDFQVIENTHYPANARALLVRLTAFPTIPATTTMVVSFQIGQFTVATATGNAIYVDGEIKFFTNTGGGTLGVNVDSGIIRIPLLTNYPNAQGLAPAGRMFQWTGLPAGYTVSTPRLRIVGWEVGP